MGEVSQQVVIPNKRGLHARASAKFVSAVSEMDGHVVFVEKDGQEAAGGSILGLMMLGAAKGDTVTVRVAGDEAEAKLAELVALVEGKFGEE
ncbi:HPr family phosphocarrier protein [Aurantiacibacter poecillastricola]|uniref:HPr family phosphocarrier protein n=1 Tax=Aurantiacibacter poecillastricola TaxID=3064385 RepID=UPI00273EE190|nr:HPr family phosphocarrier protein [Aurantiacibacter sp. 219JJ12-13]MDP5262542.1 HPr family phosphocarrier protein [Aurantiacibacter sp. 219JJ12-13]